MLTTDRIAGGVLILLGLFVVEETWRLRYPLGTVGNPGPAFTPLVLAGLVLAFGVALVVTRRISPLASAGERPAARTTGVDWKGWRHALVILVVCSLATLALERLGYRLTIGLMLACLVGVIERQRPVFAVVFAAALALTTFYLFDTLLRVPLPRGPFGF